jgi:hypothetical protein
MLRALLCFLVTLQMLLPPGFCVCHFVHGCPTTRPVEPVTPDSENSLSCCCVCRNDRVEVNVVRVQRDDQPVLLGSEGKSGLPTPADRPHAPGCPALQTVDHSKVAQRNNISLTSPAAPNGDSIFAATRSNQPLYLPTLANLPSSPPLFLAFCTLLI